MIKKRKLNKFSLCKIIVGKMQDLQVSQKIVAKNCKFKFYNFGIKIIQVHEINNCILKI